MRNARDGGGGALADAQNGEGHAINDWVIQIQKQDGRVLRRRRWKKKTNGNSWKKSLLRNVCVGTTAGNRPIGSRKGRRLERLLVGRQRRETDKTSAVAILFLCIS